MVACKLWVEEGYLGTTRLFANDQVQYYGMEQDYSNNLTAGENNTFAGYVGGINGNFLLQDMFVYVDVAEGQSLRLGIRADGRQGDGTMHPEQKNGWFKVDYFRIHQVDKDNNIINTIHHTKSAVMADTKSYTLGGRCVQRLQKGIYVQKGRKIMK